MWLRAAFCSSFLSLSLFPAHNQPKSATRVSGGCAFDRMVHEYVTWRIEPTLQFGRYLCACVIKFETQITSSVLPLDSICSLTILRAVSTSTVQYKGEQSLAGFVLHWNGTSGLNNMNLNYQLFLSAHFGPTLAIISTDFWIICCDRACPPPCWL